MMLTQVRRGPIEFIVILIYIFFLILFLVGRKNRDESCQLCDNGRSSDVDTNQTNNDHILINDPDYTVNGRNCETIHLAIVCGKFNSSRDFYVLLKSILFYRTDAIHLHLFVDNISSSILTNIFNTWTVPDVNYTLYSIPDYENEVAWIPSQHYSHRYGLMKLVFLSVLAEHAENLTKVILLDTDMLALANINLIWQEFKRFKHNSSGTIFGLVENQSDWYLGGGYRMIWPAIGRGFNTGLIMIDMISFRTLNWQQLWRRVTEKELVSHLTTTLADQDVFNAVLKENSELVYTLPCYFNYQLNDHSRLDELCPLRKLKVKEPILVHWNSPNKHNSKNEMAQYYNNWFLTFRNWDAKLLERSICKSDNAMILEDKNKPQMSTLDKEREKEFCNDVRPRPSDNLRSFIYFTQFELIEMDEFDVTLVVHLTIDRLRFLDDLALHWPGPISAAIYLSELETNVLLSSIENGDNLSRRNNIAYHLAFRDFGFNYPINKLRNIALNNAKTPYVFLSDVDFLPSLNLYSYLKRTLRELSQESSNENKSLQMRALIVPAFENLQYKFDFPTSKSSLVSQLDLGSVSMFREQLWPRGHAPTDYSKWRLATKPYRVEWRPEYEPFIVVGRHGLVRFDERFVGFGWNKVQHIMELAAKDYEFLVLPDAFVIHQFHSASYDILKHRESYRYRECIGQLKRGFLRELDQKYPEFFSKVRSAIFTSSNHSTYDGSNPTTAHSTDLHIHRVSNTAVE